MKAKHTPGPWKVVNGTNDFYIRSQSGDHIAKLPDTQEGSANARLIAEAPELLAACIEARADIEDAIKAEVCSLDDFRGTLRVLKTAIARARNK